MRRFVTPALIAGLVLAGCTPEPPGPCPRVSILGDAARMVQYKPGPGRDLIDVIFEGEVDNIASSCSYEDDDQRLDVVVVIDLVATRGPAARGAQLAKLPFFVAYADRQANIPAKAVFDSDIQIPAGRRRAGFREEIELNIPLTARQGGRQTGEDIEVLVGFQLDRDQLDQNRRQRAR